MNETDIMKKVGRVLLFCGTETSEYTYGQWANVALFARQHQIDSVLVKVLDGTNRWYGGVENAKSIQQLFLSNGVGFIPYGYFYGNTFDALTMELGMCKEYLEMFGYMCMDMEEEYNGEPGWCQAVHDTFVAHQGILLCSTWADPTLQNWTGNLAILHDTFDAFMPQEYTNYLDSTEYQLSQQGITNMIPTVYLGSDLPDNDPVKIAHDIYARGHDSISLWYDGFAINNTAAVDAIVHLFHVQQVPVSVPQRSTQFMEQQFNDVWSIGGFPATTGIAQTVKAAFLASKICACYPLDAEKDTVDWSGNKIKWQAFSNGVHAEYDIAKGHCTLYRADNTKIWG